MKNEYEDTLPENGVHFTAHTSVNPDPEFDDDHPDKEAYDESEGPEFINQGVYEPDSDENEDEGDDTTGFLGDGGDSASHAEFMADVAVDEMMAGVNKTISTTGKFIGGNGVSKYRVIYEGGEDRKIGIRVVVLPLTQNDMGIVTIGLKFRMENWKPDEDVPGYSSEYGGTHYTCHLLTPLVSVAHTHKKFARCAWNAIKDDFWKAVKVTLEVARIKFTEDQEGIWDFIQEEVNNILPPEAAVEGKYDLGLKLVWITPDMKKPFDN